MFWWRQRRRQYRQYNVDDNSDNRDDRDRNLRKERHTCHMQIHNTLAEHIFFYFLFGKVCVRNAPCDATQKSREENTLNNGLGR